MKPIVKKLGIFALVLALLMTVMPTNTYAAVKLNKTKATLQIGKTTTLKASGTSKTVTWSSTDKKIAKVSTKGVVTAVKEGKCTIKAKVKGGSTYKCEITVSTPVLKLTSKEDVSLSSVGKTSTIKTSFSNWGTLSKTLVYESADKTIASVSSKGVIKGIKAGETTITVKSKARTNQKHTIKVTVAMPSIKISSISSMDLKTEKQLKVSYTNLGTLKNTVEWNTSDENIIKVDSTGKITSVNPGEATITATLKADTRATSSVTIKVNTPTISMSSTEGKINIGEKKKLSVSKKNLGGLSNEVSFVSSNPRIASINPEGEIEGLSTGEATIIITLIEYPDATITYDVTVASVTIKLSATGLTQTDNDNEYEYKNAANKELNISASVSGLADKTLKWSSSNDGIVAVTPSEKTSGCTLKLVNKGTAIITATTVNGYTAKINVTVTDKAISTIYFNGKDISTISSLSLGVGDTKTGKITWDPEDVTGTVTASVTSGTERLQVVQVEGKPNTFEFTGLSASTSSCTVTFYIETSTETKKVTLKVSVTDNAW